jgi:predicted Zn-dependent protease
MAPQQALQAFLSQQGVRPLPAPPPGGAGASGYFEAQTEQGAVRGVTSFFTHGGTTLQLVGYTGAELLPTYDAAFRATLASFRELTDPAALAVQPARIELVTLSEALTLEQFQARHPSTIPLAELALINGVQPGATLAAGQVVKRVVGGTPPAP